MAYDPFQLSATFYANGFTGWHYRTEDEWLEVRSPEYWDDAKGMLLPGDVVFLECNSFGVRRYPTVRVHRAPDGALHLL